MKISSDWDGKNADHSRRQLQILPQIQVLQFYPKLPLADRVALDADHAPYLLQGQVPLR